MLKLTRQKQEILKKVVQGQYNGEGNASSIQSLISRGLVYKSDGRLAITRSGEREARARGWIPRWEGENEVKRGAIMEYLEEPERQLLEAVDDLGIGITRELTNQLHGQDYTPEAMERTDKAFSTLAKWYSREAIRALLCRISQLRRELSEV
jgi:hypothetical protein